MSDLAHRVERATVLLRAGQVDAAVEAAKGGSLPVQVHGLANAYLDNEIVKLRGRLGIYVTYESVVEQKMGERMRHMKSAALDKSFRMKKHPGVETKVNIFFRHVYAFAMQHAKTQRLWRAFCHLFIGMANDEASGWLLLLRARGIDAVLLLFWRRAGSLKDRATTLKQLGVHSQRVASLCEAHVLAGRATNDTDALQDILRRTNRDTSTLCGYDVEEVRSHVRDIFCEEMASTPTIKSTDDVWAGRWANCKSGSHSRRIERELFGHYVTGARANRRHFAEAVKDNPLDDCEPKTLIGASKKLEHGKTRMIYNCDTLNYMRFDRILAPVEKVWKNHSTLLGPQPSGSPAYAVIAKASEAYFMLDFDDFNSQHTIAMMKMVLEELQQFVEADLSWEIESLDNMYVNHDGVDYAWLSTLPSGHRGTTFFNTILNSAYIRAWLGDAYKTVRALHTGDDVLLCGSMNAVFSIAEKLEGAKFIANPTKQGLGSVSAEFLRCSMVGNCMFGYLPRAIASLVSGNWVSLKRLNLREYITSIITNCWSIRMRGGVDLSGALHGMLRRRLPTIAEIVASACRGEVSVLGSPVWNPKRLAVQVYSIHFKDSMDNVVERSRPSHASQQYMETHVNVAAVEATLGSAGLLKAAMVDASYGSEILGTEITGNTRDIRKVASRGAASYDATYKTLPTAVGRAAQLICDRCGQEAAARFLVHCGMDHNSADEAFVAPENHVGSVSTPTAFAFTKPCAYATHYVMDINNGFEQYL